MIKSKWKINCRVQILKHSLLLIAAGPSITGKDHEVDLNFYLCISNQKIE